MKPESKPCSFKVGDRVVCVKVNTTDTVGISNLTVGKEYVVAFVDGKSLALNGMAGLRIPIRYFRKVEKEPPAEGLWVCPSADACKSNSCGHKEPHKNRNNINEIEHLYLNCNSVYKCGGAVPVLPCIPYKPAEVKQEVKYGTGGHDILHPPKINADVPVPPPAVEGGVDDNRDYCVNVHQCSNCQNPLTGKCWFPNHYCSDFERLNSLITSQSELARKDERERIVEDLEFVVRCHNKLISDKDMLMNDLRNLIRKFSGTK